LQENECVCDDGYARNKGGECVLESECGNEPIDRTCPENERWAECDTCTEDVCDGSASCIKCPNPNDMPPGQERRQSMLTAHPNP